MIRVVTFLGVKPNPFSSYVFETKILCKCQTKDLNQNPERSGPWLPQSFSPGTLCSVQFHKEKQQQHFIFPASGPCTLSSCLTVQRTCTSLTTMAPLMQLSPSLSEYTLNTLIPSCTFPFLMIHCLS